MNVPDLMNDDFNESVPSLSEITVKPSENEVYTSYLLVNALFNLLVQKGIIKAAEITPLLADLHVSYKNGKKGLQ